MTATENPAVLLVDDQARNLDALEAMLGEMECTLVRATSADEALLSVVPDRDPRRRRKPEILRGETPNPINVPSGCRFHPRCPVAEERCKTIDPELRSARARSILTGRFPERIVEKAVERMLPRGPLGRRQLGNLRVYPDAEHPHQAQQPETLDIAAMNRKNKRTA